MHGTLRIADSRARSRIGPGSSHAIVALLALAAHGAPALAQVDFNTARVVRCGDDPSRVAASDFDGDGHLDLATGPSAVIYGDGEGNFAPRGVTIAPSKDVLSMDLNGDALDDLVVIDWSGLAVYLANGVDGFGPRSSLSPGITPVAVALADLDADGSLDLIVTGHDNAYIPLVATLLGGGAGGFDSRGVFPSGANPDLAVVTQVAAGDMDGDGFADALIAGGPVTFLRGDGVGGLASPVLVEPDDGFLSLTLADFDANGIRDAAVVNALRGDLVLLAGDGTGGFTRSATASHAFMQYYYEQVTAGDVDGDDEIDIVFPFGYVRGDGMGGLGSVVSFDIWWHMGVATGDFDEDGIVDIATTNYWGVTLLVARAPGSFLSPSQFPVGGYTASVAVGDLDEDGHVDAVLSDRGAHSGDWGGVAVLLGDGDGTFGDPARFEGPYRPYFVRVGDLDGDGHLDAGLVSPYIGGVEFLFGDGWGGLGRFERFDGPGAATDLAIADLDGDGNSDVVSGNFYGGTALVFLGDGSGGLGVPRSFAAAASPRSVAVADLNNDGRPDVVAGGATGDAISVFMGDGAGGLAPHAAIRVGTIPWSVVVADINADGLLDIATGSTDGPDVTVLLGDGGGAFTPSEDDPTPSGSGWVLAGDFDRDGFVDVATWGFGLGIRLGDGTGKLRKADANFAGLGSGYSIASADFDEDGYLDVAVPALHVLLNRTALDPIASRRGNVEAGVGQAMDVLFVNGSRGDGLERRLALGPADPLTISMEKPPLAEKPTARFALYAWAKTPKFSTVRELPLGLGVSSMPTPLSGGKPALREIWNNLGRPARLGVPTLPSSAAPSIVLNRPGGIGREIRFFLQGFIVDAAAPNGRAAVTNGVEVAIR